jgi:hypothetical protein
MRGDADDVETNEIPRPDQMRRKDREKMARKSVPQKLVQGAVGKATAKNLYKRMNKGVVPFVAKVVEGYGQNAKKLSKTAAKRPPWTT